jgi:hypothetical protein
MTYLENKDKIKKAILDKIDDKIERDNDFISFNKSYIEFIKYFKEKNELIYSDFIIGANFTYGWMPTILKIRKNDKHDENEDKTNKIVEIINKAKNAKSYNELEDNDYEILKEAINNSYVGASKLLHFINPEVYGIWDSRVHNFLQGVTRINNGTYSNRYELFIDYQKTLHELKKDTDIIEKMASFLKDHNLSTIRKIELIMFINGRRRNNTE